MASVYRPRRPRASPLWQIIHHGWDDFQAQYEASFRKAHGPLRSDAIEVVEKFYRCGDLAQGFTRLHCKDCGHEKLLAFTCKTRGYCPSCHQRRSLETADWIAKDITFNVPHRVSFSFRVICVSLPFKTEIRNSGITNWLFHCKSVMRNNCGLAVYSLPGLIFPKSFPYSIWFGGAV